MSAEWLKICKTTIETSLNELQSKKEEAERRAEDFSDLYRSLALERDNLLNERDDLLNTLRESAVTLTQVDTQGMETQQILENVRQEKEFVEKQNSDLMIEIEYLKNRVKQIDAELEETEDNLHSSQQNEEKLQEQLVESGKTIDTLKTTIRQREDMIETYKRQGIRKDNDCAALQHSMDTKNRQLAMLIKERDRLRDENESYKKNVLAGKRVITYATPDKTADKKMQSPFGLDAINEDSLMHSIHMTSPLCSPVDRNGGNTSLLDSSMNTTIDGESDSSSLDITPVKNRTGGGVTVVESPNRSGNDVHHTPQQVMGIMKNNRNIYANMKNLIGVIEAIFKVDLKEEETYDPLMWLSDHIAGENSNAISKEREEKMSAAVSANQAVSKENKENRSVLSNTKEVRNERENMQLKMYKMIIKKQEEELRRYRK
jgi:hypothetical protein